MKHCFASEYVRSYDEMTYFAETFKHALCSHRHLCTLPRGLCSCEGAKVLSQRDHDQYPFELSQVILLPLFAVAAYVFIIFGSRGFTSRNFKSSIMTLCIMPFIIGAFFLPWRVAKVFPNSGIFSCFFLWTQILRMGDVLEFDNLAGYSKYMTLRQYSLKDHFPTEVAGIISIIFLLPIFGLLAHRGLFLGDSVLDRISGLVIAECSMLIVSAVFSFSTLIEMCKAGRCFIYSKWTKKRLLSTFLPSIIRNSILQTVVYPGCWLVPMTLLDSAYTRICFIYYHVGVVFAFRVFPSYNWAPCLGGTPKRHRQGAMLYKEIFELTFSSNYTWLLAIVSTLLGATAYSLVSQRSFETVVFSFRHCMLTSFASSLG